MLLVDDVLSLFSCVICHKKPMALGPKVLLACVVVFVISTVAVVAFYSFQLQVRGLSSALA